jgi:hypothetical protein
VPSSNSVSSGVDGRSGWASCLSPPRNCIPLTRAYNSISGVATFVPDAVHAILGASLGVYENYSVDVSPSFRTAGALHCISRSHQIGLRTKQRRRGAAAAFKRPFSLLMPVWISAEALY